MKERKWGSFTVSNPLLEAFESAKTEIGMLADEMRQWEENLEENFSHTMKYEEVSECADTLENVQSTLEDIKLEEALVKVTELGLKFSDVKFTETRKRGCPRWVRNSNAISQLRAVIEEIKGIESESEDKGTYESEMEKLAEFEIEGMADDMEEAVDELESAGFPGMF